MFVHSTTISSSYGRVRASEPARFTFPSNPGDAIAVACRVDREADAELQAGHHQAADRLAHLAHELRCRAAGARA